MNIRNEYEATCYGDGRWSVHHIHGEKSILLKEAKARLKAGCSISELPMTPQELAEKEARDFIRNKLHELQIRQSELADTKTFTVPATIPSVSSKRRWRRGNCVIP